jgi:hypothetical protein
MIVRGVRGPAQGRSPGTRSRWQCRDIPKRDLSSPSTFNGLLCNDCVAWSQTTTASLINVCLRGGLCNAWSSTLVAALGNTALANRTVRCVAYLVRSVHPVERRCAAFVYTATDCGSIWLPGECVSSSTAPAQRIAQFHVRMLKYRRALASSSHNSPSHSPRSLHLQLRHFSRHAKCSSRPSSSLSPRSRSQLPSRSRSVTRRARRTSQSGSTRTTRCAPSTARNRSCGTARSRTTRTTGLASASSSTPAARTARTSRAATSPRTSPARSRCGRPKLVRAFSQIRCIGLTAVLAKFNPKDPQNMDAGHFTQIVWKGTTQLGCALAPCGKDSSIYKQYQVHRLHHAPPTALD